MRRLIFLINFVIGISALANNPGVSYQGRIFKPDGSALEGSSVQFRMQVRSPGSENCLLYEEVQTLNMAGSAGVFSLTMNDGTGTRLDTATYQVDRIFANRDTMTLDSTRCASGTTYTPNSADGRKLVVYFKDETMAAYEAMPIMNLNYVPQAMYALEAQKVGTFAVSNLLRTVDGSGNPVTAPALDPTQLTNLNSLLSGTSTQYATSTQFNTVQTFAKSAPPTCGLGEVLKSNGTALSCVTDSAGGAPVYSAITGATATNTIDNTNFAQTWNWSTATTQSPMTLSANALTTGSAMSVSTSSGSLNSTNGLLNIANTGASTSGILARFQSNSTAGSGLTVLTNGYVGVGTTSPSAQLAIASPAVSTSTFDIKNHSGNSIFNVSEDSLGYGNLAVSNAAGSATLRVTSDPSESYPFLYVESPSNKVDGAYNASGAAVFIKILSPTNSENGIFFGSGTTGSYAGAAITHYSSDGSGYGRGGLNFKTTNSANPTTRMTIDPTGNVGVGTTTPGYKLDVSGTFHSSGEATIDSNLNIGGFYNTSDLSIRKDKGAGGYVFAIAKNTNSAGAAAWQVENNVSKNAFFEVLGSTYSGGAAFEAPNAAVLGSTNGNLSIATYLAFPLQFWTNNAERMRIDSAGNVGVGTTTPQATLDLNGYARLKSYASAPVACAAGNAGALALTSNYTGCTCNGTTWIKLADATACVW